MGKKQLTIVIETSRSDCSEQDLQILRSIQNLKAQRKAKKYCKK